MKATILFLSVVMAGCSEQFPKEKPAAIVPPAPTPTSTIQPKRTLEQRALYGATAERNLMVDGDFELTGRSQQMPWLSFGSDGQSTLNYETGGRCRAGIRCAVLKEGEQLIGWFASPKQGTFTISVYVYPSGKPCKDAISVAAFDLDNQASAASLSVAGEPDASGWCLFSATLPAIPAGSPVLYVESKQDGLRIDSARAVETNMEAPSRARARLIVSRFEPVDTARRAAFERIAAIVKRTRIYGLQREPSLDNVLPDRKFRQ